MWLVIGGIVALLEIVAGAAFGQPCREAVGVNVPVSLADTTAFAWSCRGVSQTFVVASDTLIAAVTIWGPPRGMTDYWPRTLFVVGTFPDGAPNADIALFGPQSLVVPYADPVNPIPYRFVCDPPIRLPGPGTYAIVIQAAYDNVFFVAATNSNPYGEGYACDTRPL